MRPRRSCILTYHSLDATNSVISVSPALFREQMAWLASSGMPVVPLERVRDTPGAVALTFDDGFRNFFEHALPVLEKHRFPATVFVVSGFCGALNDWPSQPRNTGIPSLELMRWHEVEQAAQSGIAIGCHTATHPFLTRLPPAQVDEELRASRAVIEDRTGRAADTLAYPYGDSSPQVRAAAARHFRLACGTGLAFLSPGSDPFDLPRLDMYYLRNDWFRRLSAPSGFAYIAARRVLRDLRRVL